MFASHSGRVQTFNADVCVVGGGPAGLAAALAVSARGQAVTLLAQPLPAATGAVRDTRTTAILGDGITFLQNLGVWDRLAAVCAPLTAIRIVDERGGWLSAPEVLFDARELERCSFGFNVPNDALNAELSKLAAASPGITSIATSGVVTVAPGDARVSLKTLEGTDFRARLVIAADGRKSIARAAAGITTREWTYPQVAIATSFAHSRPHHGISTELHRRAGPLTTVPLPDGADGPSSSLVWIETEPEAVRLMALDETEFRKELALRLGGFLGTLGRVGARGTFPIRGLMATTVGKNRVVVVGEAAHVVPPIGAQGLNLGFRDAAAIADAIADHGMDDPGAAAVLDAYRRARATDLVSREVGIDLLNRSLLLDFLPIQAARGLGLQLLANSRTLRRAAMQLGLNAPGRLPSLMRPLANAH